MSASARPAHVLLVLLLLGCGEDLPPPTPDGTTVLDWSRPATGTGAIRVAAPAGELVTDVYSIRFTPDADSPSSADVGEATFELTVERRPHHVEGHSADPVWVPERVRVVVTSSGRWNAGREDGAPATCEFSTGAVHSDDEVRFHIPARCEVPLHRGERTGGVHLSIGGGPAVQVIPSFGTSEITQRPAPPTE